MVTQSAYRIYIDTQRDYTFSSALDDVTNDVIEASWEYGLQNIDQAVAPPASATITLLNKDGRYTPNDTSALYYDKLRIGTVVRCVATIAGVSYTQFELKVERVTYSNNPSRPSVTLRCTDLMDRLLGADINPELQQNVTTDQALQVVFDNVTLVYPYDAYYFFIDINEIDSSTLIMDSTTISNLYEFETGQTVLGYVGDVRNTDKTLRAQTFIRDIVQSEIGGLFFWNPKDQKFKFFNRYHFATTTSSYTLPAESVNLETLQYVSRGITNEAVVQYTPREVATEADLFTLTDTITLRPDQTRTINARFTNPDDRRQSVGGLNVVLPVAGTTFVAGINEDGSNPVSETLNISTEVGASAATLIVNNPTDVTVYIVTCTVRGQPVIKYDTEAVTAVNATSIGRYDRHYNTFRFEYINDPDFAQGVADYLVNTRGNPAFNYERAGLVVTHANYSDVYGLDIGDVITLDDGIASTTYCIIGQRHRLDIPQLITSDTGAALPAHMVEFTLFEQAKVSIFTIDTHSIDSDYVIAL